MENEDAALARQCFTELNNQLQRWFNGTCSNEEEALAGIKALMHPEMTYVYPSGGSDTLEEFEKDFRPLWGSNKELRIVTAGVTLLHSDTNTVVAEIIELQKGAKAVKPSTHCRKTTVVFERDQSGAHPLRVKRLQEAILSEKQMENIDFSPLENV